MSSEGSTPGGGRRAAASIQRFEPETSPFHADVAFGSTCHRLPLRVPPMMSQRWSGRAPAGIASKRSRSGAKNGGTSYSAASGGAFSANSLSKR